jgi:hypothetical protein
MMGLRIEIIAAYQENEADPLGILYSFYKTSGGLIDVGPRLRLTAKLDMHLYRG